MHELLAVCSDRTGLKWIAASALLYALGLIPFNQLRGDIAGIPVRPAAALPVALGILWGPGAAWGPGIGNIAGDYFGSWSPMSIAGFLVNVRYPCLSSPMCHRLVKGHGAAVDRYGPGCFLLVTAVMTVACMALLAACGTLFYSRPFESGFTGYFTNSIVWAMVTGPVLFHVTGKYAVQTPLVYGRGWENPVQ